MSGQTDISVAVSTATTDSSGRTSVKLNDKAIIYADMLSDEDVFKNTWSETFVDVISGQQIYQAICGKVGDQVRISAACCRCLAAKHTMHACYTNATAL